MAEAGGSESFARSSGFGDDFALPVPFFFDGVASLLPFNFFFAGVSSAFCEFLSGVRAFFALCACAGVDSSSSTAGFFFFAFGFGVGDLRGAGEGLFFAFGFGRGVGDSSAEFDDELSSCCAVRNSLRFSASLTCARTSVAMSALSTIAVIHRVRTRATAADRIRPERAFKPAGRSVAILPPPSGERDHVAKSRSISRRAAGGNR